MSAESGWYSRSIGAPGPVSRLSVRRGEDHVFLEEPGAEECGPRLRESEWRRVLGTADEMGFRLSRRRYGRGDLAYWRGEPTDGLYVVTMGALMARRNRPNGKEATLRILGPWDHFGHVLLTERSGTIPATSTHAVVASEECETVKVPKAFLRRICELHPALVLSLVTLDNLRLVDQEEMARCLVPRRVRNRLLELFPILTSKFGAPTESAEYAEIGLNLTHQNLAEMVSATRESVTVALAELCREGVVCASAGRIQVHSSLAQSTGWIPPPPR
ncbi:MAG: Crp/Fnr family transcriptional regulator [Rubrobacteraceae bacterium]|uniref:Crp/Fnr family transcriptional regulator n=1 Tax=Rubrobacter naiadicus TaxID=1392641 RepID=UPI0023614622|nr:Crp/Fnr family transcriptional regulator [Rubrobacter naiadicus]MBX6763743.1 Crp/Fnr family transcriptional regulator [Rubrobacteraceae bacterium]MCL6437076.1 Crp/Fnr family transcriptional regulator [Rubrobacteraceae bacterium]